MAVHLNKRGWLTLIGYLLTAFLFMWVLFIYPSTGNWTSGDHIHGEVKTLRSNSKVLGRATIKANVVLEDGQNVVVDIPTIGDVRAGDVVILSVQYDADKPVRRRYQFVSEAN